MTNVEIIPPKTDAAVVLDTPIKRGENEIKSITIRKPGAGEMRGLSLIKVGYLEVDDLIVILPRVTNPPLSKEEVEGLDPADLMAMGLKVASFLMQSPKNANYQKE